MLSALFRIIRSPWTLIVLFASKLWGSLLHFTGRTGTGITTLEKGTQNETRELYHLEAGHRRLDHQGFPILTDDQTAQLKKAFIKSIDLELVCSLAASYNNGKPCRVADQKNGSFNICFFVEFDQEDLKWIVRIPIEPALDNPWEKVVSEVATIQYLQRHTQIPIPQIHAYGRDAKLTTDGKGTQMFIISDVVPGQMLDKKLLLEGDKEHTRNFYSQLIDIFTELRGLEFPSIGSLVPNPDGSLEPVVGPVMSMSAAELREPPHALFTSASDYLRYQFKLISEMFVEPVSKHTIEDIKREIFAVHGMEQVFDLVIDARSEKGPFVLSHLDLRTPNIIVNEQLQIQGVIDWEFAITVPSKLFTPPSWITGHDSPLETDKRMHVEFREVLDEKSRDNLKCDQLRREWYDHADDPKAKIDPTDLAFCVAHVLRRTGDLVDMYCDFFAGKLSDEPLEGAISKFFDDHPDLAEEAQRQVVQCKRYAEYLEENGLYETELSRLLAQSKAFKEKMGWA